MFLIRPFTPTDQPAAKALILAGLGEYFGSIDHSLNQDVNDIQATYTNTGHLFFVVEQDKKLIGTGALIEETADTSRIVRVSIEPNYRRQGIARAVVQHLLKAAKKRNYQQVLVETNNDWYGAKKLYQTCGFQFVEERNGETHMELRLKKRD